MCAKSQNNTQSIRGEITMHAFVYSSILMRLMNGEMNWLVRITYYIGSIFIKLLTFFTQPMAIWIPASKRQQDKGNGNEIESMIEFHR